MNLTGRPVLFPVEQNLSKWLPGIEAPSHCPGTARGLCYDIKTSAFNHGLKHKRLVLFAFLFYYKNNNIFHGKS